MLTKIKDIQMKMPSANVNLLVEHLKKLFDFELYSNAAVLADTILSGVDIGAYLMEPQTRLAVCVYYGESAYNLGRYRKAEKMYSLSLQYRKEIMKCKTIDKSTINDIVPENEIKFKLHVCYVRLNMNEQAISILKTIHCRQRTPKVNMALAKLYLNAGTIKTSVSNFKEVLRECPLALEVAETLLSLDVDGAEVNSMFLSDPRVTEIEWLNLWVKAYAFMYTQNYKGAVSAFQELLSGTSHLQNSALMMVSLGETYYYSGDVINSKLILQQAFRIDPVCHRGLGLLATVHLSERSVLELERIMPTSWYMIEENDSETWIALSCLLYATSSLTTAAYFAQKACFLNPRSVESLVIKGCILYDMKKYNSAVAHFREAFDIAPHRYEPHKGLVDCYLAQTRVNEALCIASSCCKADCNSSRSLTLYAMVLMKDQAHKAKAKELLEKVLKQSDCYLPAVYLLAQIYQEDLTLDYTIAFLEKYAAKKPTAKLYQIMGELCYRNGSKEMAFQNYHAALRLEPTNYKAQEGLARIEIADAAATAIQEEIPVAGSSDSKIDSPLYVVNSSSDVDTMDFANNAVNNVSDSSASE